MKICVITVSLYLKYYTAGCKLIFSNSILGGKKDSRKIRSYHLIESAYCFSLKIPDPSLTSLPEYRDYEKN